MRTIICTLLPIALFSACSDNSSDAASKDEHHDEVHHHDSANEHMHESSFEELVARFEGPERDDYQQPDKVIEWLAIDSGMTIMDIGAGTGYFSFRLHKAGANVIAADVDSAFQEYIRHKRDSLGISADLLQLRLLPYDSPSLSPGEADKVLIVNTWHHIENREDYGNAIKEGLSPDGELVIIDFFKHELPVGPPPAHKLSAEDVHKELETAGFSVIETNDTLLPYQYCIRARR